MTFTVTADALDDLESYLKRSPDRAKQAARMALNDTAKGPGMKLLRGAVEDEVNFPVSYVNNDKIYVSKPASNENLEVRIVAKMRPVSLARFAPGQNVAASRKTGVTVTVHRGQPQHMKSAFLIRLRQGAQLTDENFNVGLAIRLKKGEMIHNKRQQSMVQLEHGLYLLYGPSISQVFSQVATEQTPFILDRVASEFLRQFARLST